MRLDSFHEPADLKALIDEMPTEKLNSRNGASWLNTIRMLAGAPATLTPISLHFPFFLSLAIVKRFSGVPRLQFGASPMAKSAISKIWN